MGIVLYQYVSSLSRSRCQVLKMHGRLRYLLYDGGANRYLAEVRNRSDHM